MGKHYGNENTNLFQFPRDYKEQLKSFLMNVPYFNNMPEWKRKQKKSANSPRRIDSNNRMGICNNVKTTVINCSRRSIEPHYSAGRSYFFLLPPLPDIRHFLFQLNRAGEAIVQPERRIGSFPISLESTYLTPSPFDSRILRLFIGHINPPCARMHSGNLLADLHRIYIERFRQCATREILCHFIFSFP